MGSYKQNNFEFLCKRELRNTQEVKNFISKWKQKELPDKNLLYDYKKICKDLLYEDEDLVRETIKLLINNIKNWAIKLSKPYEKIRPLISKENLLNKSDWYVKELISEVGFMTTSGSTTGLPFSYLRWEPFLYFIEGTNHYDLILDEFEINQNPNVFYFFNSNNYDKNKIITVSDKSKNFMEHHGTNRIANVHYVNFEMFLNNKEYFYSNIFNYLKNTEIDVMFAPGPAINSFCSYINKNNLNLKICKLLSNSNERILDEDIEFLFKGYVDHICDHMRCWDGGASFFTCKYKTYHLMDNLSWSFEINSKLITTDYFSLPSPFVNYWNGDYCKIDNEYKRCECGRLYREFEFLENRPFSLKGTCFKEIKEKIEKLNLEPIKQVRVGLNTIDVVISEKISTKSEQAISGITDKFEFRFIVE